MVIWLLVACIVIAAYLVVNTMLRLYDVRDHLETAQCQYAQHIEELVDEADEAWDEAAVHQERYETAMGQCAALTEERNEAQGNASIYLKDYENAASQLDGALEEAKKWQIGYDDAVTQLAKVKEKLCDMEYTAMMKADKLKRTKKPRKASK